MTLYTVEIYDMTSLDRLPNIQAVNELCKVICSGLIDHLLNSLPANDGYSRQLISNHRIGLHQYLGILMGMLPVDPNRPGIPYPTKVFQFCIKKRTMENSSFVKQYFTMNTLNEVHDYLLRELIVELLLNSAICMKPYFLRADRGTVFSACLKVVMTMINELSSLFPSRDPQASNTIVSAVVRVKLDDYINEVNQMLGVEHPV
jgi:hypothetical protein